jgi:hypothetical protein
MPHPTDTFEQQLVRWLCRGTQLPAPPAVLYVAIVREDDTEVPTSGTGYARAAINCNGATAPYWSDAEEESSGGGWRSKNVQDVPFPESTGVWAPANNRAVKYRIYDAATGGTLRGECAIVDSNGVAAPSEILAERAWVIKANTLLAAWRVGV